MEIAGRVALVTGGASGLGRATVEALHAAGAAVVIADLAGGDEVAAALGDRAVAVTTDVTDEASVRAAIAAAASSAALHIAVSCAGIGTPGRVLSREGPLPWSSSPASSWSTSSARSTSCAWPPSRWSRRSPSPASAG